MFNREPDRNLTGILLAHAAVLTLSLTGCGSGNSGAPSATPQGTVPLDSVKVGMPETVFQDAILTFVPDPKGSLGRKVQYLSRSFDAKGGQYVVQCRNGKCFGVQIYHVNNSPTRQVAFDSLKQLFPADLPAQSKVEEMVDPSNPTCPVEVIYFGDNYKGELTYSDKNKKTVYIISAWIPSHKKKSTTSQVPDSATQ